MKADLHFARKLQALMDQKGMNAFQLSKALGVSHVAVGNWLKGSAPKTEAAIKIAEYFGVKIEDLLGQSSRPASGIPPFVNRPSVTARDLENLRAELKAFVDSAVDRLKDKLGNNG